MSNKIKLSERIFIAGSNGMAGSAIKKCFINAGYGLKEKKGILLTPTRKDLNLMNYDELLNWFKKYKPTVVVLAAAKVGGIHANYSKPADFILENLKIQTNVIDISWKMGVKRLLFLGSSCIYPKFAPQPIEEESLLTNSLEKTNEWYALAKIAGIKLCEALRKQYGFDAICLMPTNLYGPNDNYHKEDSHVMASLIRKFYEAKMKSIPNVSCWGSGAPFREFMHVNDLADAVLFALEKWDPTAPNAPLDKNGNALTWLNVGTGKDISIRDLANKIAYFTNYDGDIIWDHSKPDGTPKKQLNVNRINNLGWYSKISLDKGLKETLKNFKNATNFDL